MCLQHSREWDTPIVRQPSRHHLRPTPDVTGKNSRVRHGVVPGGMGVLISSVRAERMQQAILGGLEAQPSTAGRWVAPVPELSG